MCLSPLMCLTFYVPFNAPVQRSIMIQEYSKFLKCNKNDNKVVHKHWFFKVGLRFDHNSIVDLEPGSFQDLPNLETLILTKNGISRLKRGAIRNLPSLQKIKLNENLIQELEEKSFADLLSLKELYLQHNLIDNIDERAFVRVPSLR